MPEGSKDVDVGKNVAIMVESEEDFEGILQRARGRGEWSWEREWSWQGSCLCLCLLCAHVGTLKRQNKELLAVLSSTVAVYW